MPHRHLIGCESPPEDHAADNYTMGPVLPEGWDGDAWARIGNGANSYWLRAWNKSTGAFATASAETYEAARAALLQKIGRGGTGRAVITIREI